MLTWFHIHILIIKEDILILGKGPAQGLDDTTLTVEAKYSINYTEQGKKFVWVFITMEATVIFLLMLQKIHQIRAKYSEIIACPLCLRNISKNFR